MKTTFLDTSFLIALGVTDDEHHERALAWQDSVEGELLTTEYVLVEYADALSTPAAARRLANATTSVLRRNPAVRIIPATTSLLDEGLEWFVRHEDKAWSLTDCVSFLVMRREAMHDALSSDRHFEQAGFRAVASTQPRSPMARRRGQERIRPLDPPIRSPRRR